MNKIKKNIPNFLSFLRVILSPSVLFLYLNKEIFFSAILILLLLLTDFLDGYLARKWNIISNFGKIFDPLGDKILTIIVFYIGFLENIVSSFILKFLILKEFLLIFFSFLIFIINRKNIKISEANIFGKTAMIANSILCLLTIMKLINFINKINLKYFNIFILVINSFALFSYLIIFIKSVIYKKQ